MHTYIYLPHLTWGSRQIYTHMHVCEPHVSILMWSRRREDSEAYMHIHVNIYTNMRMCIYKYICINTYRWGQCVNRFWGILNVYTCVCVCVCVCVCIHTYIYMCLLRKYAYVHIHIHMYVHTDVHTHIFETQICVCIYMHTSEQS